MIYVKESNLPVLTIVFPLLLFVDPIYRIQRMNALLTRSENI